MTQTIKGDKRLLKMLSRNVGEFCAKIIDESRAPLIQRLSFGRLKTFFRLNGPTAGDTYKATRPVSRRGIGRHAFDDS